MPRGAVRDRPAGPLPARSPVIQNGLVMTRPGRRPIARRTTSWRRRSADDRPRHDRRGDVGGPDDQVQRARDPASLPPRRRRARRVARPVRGHPVDGVRARPAPTARRCWRSRRWTAAESSGVALGTASRHRQARAAGLPGQPRRVRADHAQGRRPVVGAAYLAGDDAELVFITSDAQLLRFPAASVRPQGRPAGGMAGIRLDDGADGRLVRRDRPGGGLRRPRRPTRPVVVTVAGRSGALPGTGGASRQGHAVRRVPGQGPRHRRRPLPALPQGRGRPDPAWIGPGPGLGATESGVPVDLSDHDGPARRLRQRPHPPASPPRPPVPPRLTRHHPGPAKPAPPEILAHSAGSPDNPRAGRPTNSQAPAPASHANHASHCAHFAAWDHSGASHRHNHAARVHPDAPVAAACSALVTAALLCACASNHFPGPVTGHTGHAVRKVRPRAQSRPA